MPDETTTTTKYPQINLNTGVSLTLMGAFIAGGIYFAGIKSDVGYQEQRITSMELSIKELKAATDLERTLQTKVQTQLEVRLTRIEILLQDLLTRIGPPPQQRR